MVRINLIPGFRHKIRLEDLWKDVCTGLFIGFVIEIAFFGYLIAVTVSRP